MRARGIFKLAALILLLVWEPGPTPRQVPHRSPEGGGAWLDVGFRVDPAHPWTSWRLYVDFHRESAGPEAGREQGAAGEAAPAIELGPADLARAAGGASYLLLKSGLESLPGGEGAGGKP